MKKSTVVRIVIMALSVVLTVTCFVLNKSSKQSVLTTVTGTVTRVDMHPAVDTDDHDTWDVYAKYEYQGTVFSDVHVSSQAGYKVGDPVQIQVNAQGKDLDRDIDSSQFFSLIGVGIFALTAFTFLLAPKNRNPGVTAQQRKLNYTVVQNDLIAIATRWNGTTLRALSYISSGLYFAMFSAFLANTLLYGGDPFMIADCLGIAVVLFVLPTMKRKSLLKNIEQGHFQITTSKCMEKCVGDGDDTNYYLVFDNREIVYLPKEVFDKLRVSTEFYFVSIEGRKHPPLWYLKDYCTLDDDLLPFFEDAV